jgi:hypothetical protein
MRRSQRARLALAASDALPITVDVVRAGFVLGWAANAESIDEVVVVIDGIEARSAVRVIHRPDLVGPSGEPSVGFIVTFDAESSRRPRQAELQMRTGHRFGAASRIGVGRWLDDWSAWRIGS